jgi:hypothetical protein
MADHADMSRHRPLRLLALFALLTAAPACDAVDRTRSRIGTGTTDTLTAAATGSGLVLGLQAPGILQTGEEGVLRLSVTNRADTAVTDISLELIVPAWAEPMPPRVGDREVTMAALPDGGTRFAYDMQDAPLQAGQAQSVEQRIRVASALARDPNAPTHGVVRVRLLGSDGQPLAEVEGQIMLDSAAVSDTTRATAAEIANRREQIGPVRLGMTAAALRQAATTTRDTTWTQEGMAQRGAWVPLSGRGRVLAVLSGDSVVRLEVRDTVVRTREQLGVGSRLEELRASYGPPCADAGEGTVVVWFANAPGISFALDVPVPTDVAQMRANPDRLPGTARVTRWWLRRGVSNCPR